MKKSFWKIIFYAFTLIMIFSFIYYFRLRLLIVPSDSPRVTSVSCPADEMPGSRATYSNPAVSFHFEFVSFAEIPTSRSNGGCMDANWNNFTFPSSTSQRSSNHHHIPSLVSWSAKWDIYMCIQNGLNPHRELSYHLILWRIFIAWKWFYFYWYLK